MGRKLSLWLVCVIIVITYGIGWLNGVWSTTYKPLSSDTFTVGKDTIASFGNDSFQIMHKSIENRYGLEDLKAGKTLISNVKSYTRTKSGATAFIYGADGSCVILDQETNLYHLFRSIDEVPEDLRNIFEDLTKKEL